MQDFILSVKSVRLSEPSIGAFNNPSFGQEDKSLGFVRAKDNFQSPRKMLFDPVKKKFVSIAAISPDNGGSLAYSDDFGEEQRCSVTVCQRSIRDSQSNDKAERIDKHVSFNTAQVTMSAPGGASDTLRLAVQNPEPALSSLLPASIDGLRDTVITASGTGFTLAFLFRLRLDTAIATLPTFTLLSATEVRLTIPAALIPTLGTYQVSVFSPTPDGDRKTNANCLERLSKRKVHDTNNGFWGGARKAACR